MTPLLFLAAGLALVVVIGGAIWVEASAKLDIDLDNLDAPRKDTPCDLFGHVYPTAGYVRSCRYCGHYCTDSDVA